MIGRFNPFSPIGGGSRAGSGAGAAGAPTVPSAGAATGGAQGVPFSRTTTSADTAFVTTQVTLPKSGKPRTVIVTCSTGIVQVQVTTIGSYAVSGVATPQVPLVLDISMLPDENIVNVQTLLSAVGTVAGSVTFE